MYLISVCEREKLSALCAIVHFLEGVDIPLEEIVPSADLFLHFLSNFFSIESLCVFLSFQR